MSEEAERSRPFASALGQLMMTQRATEAVAKQVAVISSSARLCMLDVSAFLHLLCIGHFAQCTSDSLGMAFVVGMHNLALP